MNVVLESQTYRDIRERLASRLKLLPDKPEETADSTLRALWFAAAGAPVSAELAAIQELPELDDAKIASLERLVRRRIDGVPLAHITGRQRFMGMEMLAGPEALVPRKETELLGRAAVDLAAQLGANQECVKIIDICTGSGNIAFAVAHHVANARVFASDLSEAALDLARRNAKYLALQERVEFRAGDLFAPFDKPDFCGKVDVLTCNPPYINSAKVAQMLGEVSDHEPKLAFDGGPFGVAILMRVLQEAPRFIRDGGWLAVEVGLGQGPAMVKRIEKDSSFREARAATDESGAIRVVLARC